MGEISNDDDIDKRRAFVTSDKGLWQLLSYTSIGICRGARGRGAELLFSLCERL